MESPVVSVLPQWINHELIKNELQQLSDIEYTSVVFPKYTAIFNLDRSEDAYFRVKIDDMKKAVVYRLVQILQLDKVNNSHNHIIDTSTTFENLLSVLTLSRAEILKDIEDQGLDKVQKAYVMSELYDIVKDMYDDPGYMKYIEPIVSSIKTYIHSLKIKDSSMIMYDANSWTSQEIYQNIIELILVYYREDIINNIIDTSKA